VNTGGEDGFLALFGVISLDNPHAAKRFCQPARHLGANLAPLAKNRPDCRESFIQRNAKAHKRPHSNQRHLRTGAKQENEGDSGCDQAADKIHQARTQQVANAFYIAHDARYQTARFVDVVKSYRQAGNVNLHLLP
jgi:hypothetical protein